MPGGAWACEVWIVAIVYASTKRRWQRQKRWWSGWLVVVQLCFCRVNECMFVWSLLTLYLSRTMYFWGLGGSGEETDNLMQVLLENGLKYVFGLWFFAPICLAFILDKIHRYSFLSAPSLRIALVICLNKGNPWSHKLGIFACTWPKLKIQTRIIMQTAML